MNLTPLKFLHPLKDLLSNPLTSFSIFLFITVFVRFCFHLVPYVRQHWRVVRYLRTFPSSHVDVNWSWRIICGFYPKDVPFSNRPFLEGTQRMPRTQAAKFKGAKFVVFQLFLKECKRFTKEGICVLRFFYPVVFNFNPDFHKIFFSESSIVDKSIFYNLLTDVFGNGLLLSNGNVYKSHRKLLNPAFSPIVLKGKMGIFNENAAELVQKLQAVSGKPTVKVIEFLKTQTFNILAESILGIKVNDEKYGSKVVKYVEAIERMCEVLVYRLARPWLYWRVTMPLFSGGRKYLKVCDDIRTFTQDILQEMNNSALTSKVPDEVSDSDSESKKSFARILMEQHLKDPDFTLQDVQDHLTTFLAGGHDTSSYAMMWCLYLLGHHPQVQEKAFVEIQNIKGRDVTYEELCELNYLECVIKETLRLYPVAPVIARKLSKDIQCGEYTIPKGADIVYFFYLLHRNPDIYEDPDAFKPERFSGNSTIRPWMSTSFAEGYRSCIGKKFAMMEMKVMLAHILRRFEIKTLDKIEEKDLDWVVTLKPVKPARILFTVRQSGSPAR